MINPISAPFPADFALSGDFEFKAINNIKPASGIKNPGTANPLLGVVLRHNFSRHTAFGADNGFIVDLFTAIRTIHNHLPPYSHI